MIHLDFNERYQDEAIVGSAISRRDGVMLSVVFHAFLLGTLVFAPRLPIFQPDPEELQRRELRPKPNEDRTFVFIQPKVDLPALRPPDRAPLSDLDRQARAPELSLKPLNPLPFARGNSPERVEADNTPPPPKPEPPAPQPETQTARAVPPTDNGFRPDVPPRQGHNEGPLHDALRNLQRYVQNETFNNPQGAKDKPGTTIQFDSMGVEFGPWLRRFVAQIRRNWFIPEAAMTFRGHVVLQFNIHKDGTITDLVLVGPSGISAFNNASMNAIKFSNPTVELPAEYPADKAAFTVTFLYNEEPDQ